MKKKISKFKGKHRLILAYQMFVCSNVGIGAVRLTPHTNVAYYLLTLFESPSYYSAIHCYLHISPLL